MAERVLELVGVEEDMGHSPYSRDEARALREARGKLGVRDFARRLGKAMNCSVPAHVIFQVEHCHDVDWASLGYDSMALFLAASTVSGIPLSCLFRQPAWSDLRSRVARLELEMC